MTLLLISFVAGVLTVLAPCILPLLPVIIGGSLTGTPSTRRAFVITAALGISVFLFTLILKVSTAFISIPPAFWQWLSGGILFAVGLFMLFPSIWESIVPASLNTRGNRLMAAGTKRGGIGGDILIGAALGPVFSSCSPTYFILLAAVLPVHLAQGLFYLIAYVIGLSLALFAIAFLGQRLVTRLGIAADPRGWFKRIVGLLFILIGLAVISGIDKKIQTALPSWAFGIADVEQSILMRTNATGDEKPTTPEGAAGEAGTSPVARYLTLKEKAKKYGRVPELVTPDAYLNTDLNSDGSGKPITLAEYRGKSVVLVDFWTYSCINCQRTTPYLVSWYEKYRDQGFVIVGVHTPEFAFEHVVENVAAALKSFGIEYPVVLDNEYRTWNAFNNRFWPHKYLVDIDGYIVYDHIGEGAYDTTERAIQEALKERAARLGVSDTVVPATTGIAPPDLSGVGSPETYFGGARNEYLGNGTRGRTGLQTLTLPENPVANTLYLGGTWNITSEYAESASDTATILYRYIAKDVYLVGAANALVSVEVLQDGAPATGVAGADTDASGTLPIQKDRLYKVIHNSSPGTHILELRVKGKGLKVYTFTFG